MSTLDLTIQLGIITQQINRYAPIFLLLFGFIGNFLNCPVFTRPIVRTNPCAVYLLISSVANLIIFIGGFVPEIIDGWNVDADLKETVSSLCKLTLYLLFISRCISAWMIAFATIDRYLVSSPNIHRRRKSNLKNTYRCIAVICVVSLIAWVHLLICFEANIVGTPVKCFAKSNACRLLTNAAEILVLILSPTVIMLVFGFGTIRNTHRSRQVVPNTISEQSTLRNRRRENSLTKMLLSQVLALTLLTLPFAITTAYLSITFYQEKSMDQRAIENFIFNILFLVLYIPNCISFFFFTLSGTLFRETLIEIGKNFSHIFNLLLSLFRHQTVYLK